MNIIIMIVILLFLLYQDYCYFYVKFLKTWVLLCNCIMRYLHTHVYVSMQYGWEEKMAVEKEKQKKPTTNHINSFFKLPPRCCLFIHPQAGW